MLPKGLPANDTSVCAFCEREGVGTVSVGDGGAWCCLQCGDELVSRGERDAEWFDRPSAPVVDPQLVGWDFADAVSDLVACGLEMQSPIERQFASALACAAFHVRVMPLRRGTPDLADLVERHQGVLAYSFQHPIKGYFADLYLELHVKHGSERHPLLRGDDGVTSLVVECDGHEFHDRTREQASHDRARDRAMAFAGLQVFRFTGSDIYRGPMKCAREALAMLGVKA